MKRFGQALRLLQINAVFIRHGLDEILLAAPPLRRLRFLFYLLPWNWGARALLERAARCGFAGRSKTSAPSS